MDVVGYAVLNALAVKGSEGIIISITVLVVEGLGVSGVFIDANPELVDGFAPSAYLALFSALLLSFKPSNYTVIVSVDAPEPVIGGPSASAYIAASLLSILMGFDVDRKIAMTGAATPFGLVGQVRDVAKKVEIAEKQGLSVLVPVGQGVGGAIEVADILSAAELLSGVRINTSVGVDYSVYRLASKWVYVRVVELARRLGVEIPDSVHELAKEGRYYVAASLLYSRIAKSGVTINQIGEGIGLPRPNTANIDVLVVAVNRARRGSLTADIWAKLADVLIGAPISGSAVRTVAREFLDAAMSASALMSAEGAADRCVREFEEGDYVGSIECSVDLLARFVTGVAIHGGATNYLTPMRTLALYLIGRSQRLGYPASVPLMYLELGDYWADVDPDKAARYYAYALAYASVIARLATYNPGNYSVVRFSGDVWGDVVDRAYETGPEFSYDTDVVKVLAVVTVLVSTLLVINLTLFVKRFGVTDRASLQETP